MNRAFVVLACGAGLLLGALLLLRADSPTEQELIARGTQQDAAPEAIAETPLEPLEPEEGRPTFERTEAQSPIPDIQGKLLDPEGHPAPGVTIQLFEWVEDETEAPGYVERAQTSSSESGHFEFSESPAGPWIAVAHRKNASPEHLGDYARSAKQRETWRQGKLQLRSGLPLELLAVNERGEQLREPMQVHIESLEPVLQHLSPWTWESPGGALSLVLFPGSFRIVVMGEDQAPSERRVRLPGPTRLRFQLDRNGLIRGTVFLSDGQPAAGVRVEATRTGGKIHQVTTDDQGRYSLLEVPAGDYDVAAWIPARGASRDDQLLPCLSAASVIPCEEVLLDLTFPRGATVEGTVSGMPQGAKVSLYSASHFTLPLCEASLNEDHSFTFRGLDAGAYLIVLERRYSVLGFSPYPIELTHGATRQVTMEREADGPFLRGRVTFPDGRPARAKLFAYDVRFPQSHQARGSTTCNKDGTFQLARPEAASIRLVALLGDGWATERSVSWSENEIQVRLQPAGIIEWTPEWNLGQCPRLPGLWTHFREKIGITTVGIRGVRPTNAFPWPAGTWDFEGGITGGPKTATLTVTAGETVHIREALLTPGHASKR